MSDIPATAAGEMITIDLNGRFVPFRVRRNPRSKRIVLRIDESIEGAVITLPTKTQTAAGIELALRKADWILDHLNSLPPRIPFADGTTVPLLGVDRLIRHRPDSRHPVSLRDDEIHVTGRPEHLARRLTDWLRREARLQITSRAAAKAPQIGCKAGRISVRDTRSRWGSCSSSGNMSFCWRLVMAPEWVLEYVIAHEVAHLAYLCHDHRFWQTVAKLNSDVEKARAWLRRHGPSLHRYGESSGASFG